MADEKPAKKKPRQSRKGRARTLTEQLTGELAALLARELVPDLARRARQPAVERALRRRHAAERAAKRTAARFEEWAAHTVEQVGAAWILSCLFVRVLEDRGLMDRPRIAGPGALDAQQVFFDIAPSLTERDYLLTVFRELACFPGMEDVLGPRHNPAWRLSPSNDAVRALLSLLRQTGPEGALRFGFAGTDTRFLGDLYQDLSESVRKRFALLQTPGFVEGFILDQTLEPAIAGFGLDAVRVIDPTCGSGHFLLGAFERLVEHRMRTRPGLDRREHARDALAQVFGVDVNPYAVAIARFRLTLAYLAAAGIDELARAPRIETNLVVADSLLHETAHQQGRLSDLSDRSEDKVAWGDEMFALDDPESARRILGQRYHAVVGNPPYITCKDAVLRDVYRAEYDSAAGKFALAAPFTERFFQLAEERGFVGLINANSFMKREFGKPLIEKVLPRYELTRVVDTSGAFIPGHGTPTVLLFGRNQKPVLATVRAVLGKRGEPGTPEDAEKGLVWSSIAAHFDEPEFEDEYISVPDMPRETFGKHPWSLGGGGAAELKEVLEKRAEQRLGKIAEDIGFASFTGLDDAFILPEHAARTYRLEESIIRSMVAGESIRDWTAQPVEVSITPYDKGDQSGLSWAPAASWARFLWPYRTTARNISSFGGKSREQEGQNWWQWYRWQPERYVVPFRIAFAFVATHNHFVLDRGGKVFNRSAPIIKLPASATEDDHLALLAYLNSSTACFWMKQVFHKKSSASQKHHTDPARAAYEFAGTGLQAMPIPKLDRALMVRAARLAADLASRRAQWVSGEKLRGAAQGLDFDKQSLDGFFAEGWREYDALTAQAVYVQEEIDWHVYASMGLVDDVDIELEQVHAAPLGSRPFEHETGYRSGVSERVEERAEPGNTASSVARPAHWERRLALLREPRIAMLERPEFKRMWRDTERNVSQPEFRREATRQWVETYLLDLLEGAISREDRILSLRQLRSSFDASLEARWTGAADFLGENGDDLLARLVAKESVPYLAQLRYTASGLDKLRVWQEVWEQQRAEDRDGKRLDVPVPPKYAQADFQDAGYWRLRGKLDVPKERFLSYPGAEGDDDRSPLMGWAGWDHLQRAQALAALLQQRKDIDGWEAARLMPLLAGLDELVPWLKQWHNQPDPAFDNQRMGDLFEDFVRSQARDLGLDLEQVRAWMPARKQRRGSAAKRGSTAKKKTTRKRATKPAEEA